MQTEISEEEIRKIFVTARISTVATLMANRDSETRTGSICTTATGKVTDIEDGIYCTITPSFPNTPGTASVKFEGDNGVYIEAGIETGATPRLVCNTSWGGVVQVGKDQRAHNNDDMLRLYGISFVIRSTGTVLRAMAFYGGTTYSPVQLGEVTLGGSTSATATVEMAGSAGEHYARTTFWFGGQVVEMTQPHSEGRGLHGSAMGAPASFTGRTSTDGQVVEILHNYWQLGRP